MTTVRITDAGGNKPTFVQWDVDRVLYITGVTSTPCLHFANAELKRAIVVEAEESGGKYTCKVPNFILQFALPVIISVFTQPEGGEGRTEATVVIGVQPKKKPQDYTYEENIGYINWVNLTAEIQRMLDDGELKGDPGPKGDPPTVDVEQTYYGNKVTFTGSNGAKTINVLDGMTSAVKEALLDLFEHVAYIDGNGQQYYDALDAALNPVIGVTYIEVAYDPGAAIIYNNYELAQLKPYLTVTAHYEDDSSATITDYTLSGTLATGTDTITVSYGGKTAFFTVEVVEWLVSIDAVFTQGSATIYDTDSLDTLRQYLVVTASFADSTSAVVTNYTLSGALTSGTSTISVDYGGKTDSFVVQVSPYWTYTWDYTDGKLEDGPWNADTSGTTTSTLESDGQKITANNSSQVFIYPDDDELAQKTINGKGVIEVVAAVNISSSVATGLRIGIGEALTGGASSGVSINTAQGKLTYNNGSSSNVDTGISIASGTDYTFRLELNETVGAVYLNGSLVATVSNATTTKYAGAYYVAWQNGSSSTYYALIKSVKIRNGGV